MSFWVFQVSWSWCVTCFVPHCKLPYRIILNSFSLWNPFYMPISSIVATWKTANCLTLVVFFVQFLVQPEWSSRHQVILVASADTAEGLNPTIRRCFSHEISMESLTEEKRSIMITQKLTSFIKTTNQVLDSVVLYFHACRYILMVFIFIWLFLSVTILIEAHFLRNT
jgi:hypothetical protein